MGSPWCLLFSQTTTNRHARLVWVIWYSSCPAITWDIDAFNAGANSAKKFNFDYTFLRFKGPSKNHKPTFRLVCTHLNAFFILNPNMHMKHYNFDLFWKKLENLSVVCSWSVCRGLIFFHLQKHKCEKLLTWNKEARQRRCSISNFISHNIFILLIKTLLSQHCIIMKTLHNYAHCIFHWKESW